MGFTLHLSSRLLIKQPGGTSGKLPDTFLLSSRTDPSSSHSFYLGVSPSLLLQFYGRSYAHAESSFASLAFEAFPTDIPPISSAYSTPTYQILSAVANRPPRGQPVGHHLEMSRHLLGTGLANQLALPRGSWKERMTVELELWLGWMFVHFGRAYRRGWEMERQGWFREVIPLLVLYNLGERRSTFAWRNEERREEKLGHDEGEEPVGRSIQFPAALELTRPHVYRASRWASLSVKRCAAGGIGSLARWSPFSALELSVERSRWAGLGIPPTKL